MEARINTIGTVVHATHHREDKLTSCIRYKIRLESGKLLMATAFSATQIPNKEDGLAALYNSAGGGIGHELALDLDVSNPPEVKVMSIKDLGVDPAYPARSLCRDRGFLDSLPVIGPLRGNRILTNRY